MATVPFTRSVASGPVASTAAGADASGRYVVAPYDGAVTGARIIAAAGITGANTDSRTVEIRNRGQAGAGNALVANKAFTAGVNAVADTTTGLNLTGVAADLNVAAGDILEVVSLHVGATGLAGPEFTAIVDFQPNYS